jgi:tRNA threonylcarbamoyladenosine biosynthesis protein TsaB
MALILNIESATNICSVSIARNGKLLGSKESRDDKSHSSLLTIFIGELISELQLEFSDLDAVAVSKGPGSYTGLRIGVSTAKGIAYGAGLKLIGIPTLQTMAFIVTERFTSIRSDKNILLCPMIDARRMEVFTALYTPDNLLFKEISAEIIHPGIFFDILREKEIWFFGNGSEKCRDVICHPNARFIEGIEPSSIGMVKLAEQAFQNEQFEDIAYFEPFYLKDFIATVPRNKLNWPDN